MKPAGAKRRRSRCRLARHLVRPLLPVLLLLSCEARSPTPRQGDSVQTLAFACTGDACHAMPATLESPQGALFERGEIDLTGDGVPEVIERDDASLVVIQDGREAWRSPDTWTVVDADLGDPNDDGRHEIMVAFWKKDADGVLRSQPFVVGYREGRYREVWGGSPVSEPIQELALGDVDGDGVDDLVVLDAVRGADDEHQRTVSVWRWHGWGFSLVWRSEPGAYRDLVTSPDDDTVFIMVSKVSPAP